MMTSMPLPRLRIAAPLALLAVAGAAALGTAQPASAATCADHPNQRSAQLAKDTRDGDGDGIYCEALPCPCLKPGEGTTGSASSKRPAKAKAKGPARYRGARVIKVVDGDTLHARHNGRTLKVRLIGIDTPESNTARFGHTECGGIEASLAHKDLMRRWPKVTLRTDDSQDRIDQYGRVLAYVVPERSPKTSYQQELLRLGWAAVYVYGGKPFKWVNRFQAAADGAARVGAGVWTRCGGDFRLPIDD